MSCQLDAIFSCDGVNGRTCLYNVYESILTQGYITIEGRLKDLIIRGGENIAPKEVEQFLYSHWAVRDVQVSQTHAEKHTCTQCHVVRCVMTCHAYIEGLIAAHLFFSRTSCYVVLGGGRT